MRTIVIVGANAAGSRAAEMLRAEGFAGRVVLIDADPHLPYERPPLSKRYLTGELEAEQIAFKPAAFYAERAIDLRLGVRATRLDAAGAIVHLDGGAAQPYDQLLIATGSTPRRLDLPGAELSGVVTLRTLADAERLRRLVREARQAVVVGGGFIGMEVAASCRRLGLRVTVVEAGPAPMARALGPELGRRVAQLHAKRGVEVLTGQFLTAFEGRDRVERVLLADGRVLPADVVLVGVGVMPDLGWLEGAGIDLAGGIVTDEESRTNLAGVYAAGDVAAFWHPDYGARLRLEHFDHARAHGAAAAKAILGRGMPYAPVPSFWSDQYDVTIQQVGLPDPVADLVYRGDPQTESWSAFFVRDDHLASAVGLNRNRDISAAHRMMTAKVSVETRLLADESVDLRALARGGVA
jgi:3-phenylpropionate/trans-cinnamate dioxygenase ferredoxin reductase subunit